MTKFHFFLFYNTYNVAVRLKRSLIRTMQHKLFSSVLVILGCYALSLSQQWVLQLEGLCLYLLRLP